ncbi:MAG: hypothetical protein GEV08_24105 [Acidimicrobiia bacterium]|nr:hypothetical protein [Acidimicrobiia bacterium]
MSGPPGTTLAPPQGTLHLPGGRVGWSVGAFVVVALVLAGVVAFSHGRFSSGEYVPAYEVDTPGLLEGWYQFDAGWYERVAQRGYDHVPGEQSPVAFFPAYPYAMAAVAPLVGGSEAVAGIVLTFACGMVAVALFTVWCRDRLAPDAVPWAVAALLLFPYSWYLVGAVYADALFLAATLGAFVLLERGHPMWAGVVGIVAAAGRPVAPAVVLALAVRALERRGALVRLASRARPVGAAEPGSESTSIRRRSQKAWSDRIRPWLVGLGTPVGIDWRRARPADAGVLLAAFGFLAYCGYLWARFGDPFLFNTVQRYWDQPSGPITWAKGHLVGNLIENLTDKPRYLLGCLFQGALTVGALLLVPRVIRRFGWGYGALVGVLMAMPAIGSKDFQGTGRYLLAAFPLFALAGEWLAERSASVRGSILAASAVLLLLWAHLYARGFYVA